MTHMGGERGSAGMGLGPVGRVQGWVTSRDCVGWGTAEPGWGCTRPLGAGPAAVVVRGMAVRSREGRGKDTGRVGADAGAAEA